MEMPFLQFLPSVSGHLHRGIPFALVLGLAFFARNFGWNWDEGTFQHPDERHVVMTTAALQAPGSLRERFDTEASPFNPYNRDIDSYVYGALPMEAVHRLSVNRGRDDMQDILRTGRRLSALWSTGTVALLMLLGVRLVSPRFGLTVGGLMAFTVLSIQQAHFFTVDSAGVFFATLCTALGLLGVREKRTLLLTAAAVTVGPAMACRLNLGLLGVWVVAAGGALAWNKRSVRPLLGVLAGGAAAFLLFRFLQPFAFTGTGWIPSGLNAKWVEDLRQVHAISHGNLEVPFTLQWVRRLPYVYALEQLMVWGMGPLLGIVAVGGSCVLLWKRRLQPGHWQALLALWPLLLIGYHGRIFLHTQRYFLPAYPQLILGGALAVRTLLRPGHARIVLRILLASTLLYALAFLQMYREPHPRIAASEWLYRELPTGGSVAGEEWDDLLPLRLPDRQELREDIRFASLPVYAAESPEKSERLVEKIRDADFLVPASTRASHSIPRLPSRYPVTTRFYQTLESDPQALGLERAATFWRSPRLFGIQLNTLRAEEAFRVYDHPLVRIYRKTDAFDAGALQSFLEREVFYERIPAVPYTRVRSNAGMLTPDQLERRHGGSTWQQQFPDNALGNRNPVTIWVLALLLLGAAGFPLSAHLFPHLSDGGWAVSRLLVLSLITWLAWLPAALEWIRFESSVTLAAAVVCGVSAMLFTLHPDPVLRALKRAWPDLLRSELLLWGVFAFFLWTRFMQPDLWHPWAGGEKPMDFAFLAASARTPFFPPEHPWLSGAFINYYYLGFVQVAALIQLTGISPDLAYNLALPTLAMFTAGGVICLTRALFPLFRSGPGWRGMKRTTLLALVLTLFAGNLGQLRTLLERGFSGHPWFLYWNASRVLRVPEGEVEPITEFPFFSLIHGDLHAHLMALPLALLGLLAAWQLFRRFHPLRLVFSAFVLGTLWVVNTWDVPIQTAWFLLALFLPARNRTRSERPLFLWSRLGWAVLALLFALLAYAPYHWQQAPHGLDVVRWTGPRSRLADLLLAHGLFLLPLSAGGFLMWRDSLFRREARLHRVFPLLMVAGSCAAILLVELFTLRIDVERMNVVFKVYYQIWPLLAVVTALVAVRMRFHKKFLAFFLLLLSLSLLYPFTALPAKLRDRYWAEAPRGLDGWAFVENALWSVDGEVLDLSDDFSGMRWLRRNARPGDVILEARLPAYQWGARMATATALPSLLGWEGHLIQQRPWPGGAGEVQQRQAVVDRFFREGDPAILRPYGVRYIVLGALEAHTYGAEALERIERHPDTRPVWRQGEVSILEVSAGGAK